MEIKCFMIDAFTDRVFAWNPAGICFLDAWVDDSILQSVASENNLSETAFLLQAGDHYELRWFTPEMEIDLCGHATLAGAFAIFEHVNPKARRVDFQTKSGRLSVERQGALLMMDFPARQPEPCKMPDNIGEIVGIPPSLTLRSRDLLAVYEDEQQIRRLKPDLAKVAALDYFAVIGTCLNHIHHLEIVISALHFDITP